MLTKTLRDGREVTITRDHHGEYVARFADGSGMVSRGPLERHPRPPAPQVTHRIGRLGLTAEEATAAEKLAEPPTPEISPEEQRELLVRSVNAAHAADAEDHAQAQDEGCIASYFHRRKPVHDAAIDRAEAELAEFDRAHPEVVASIRAREAEDVQRWMGH